MERHDEIKKQDNASGAVPLILYMLGILAAGGMYTLCFIYIAPTLHDMIPDGYVKTTILGIILVVPLIILFVGAIALIIEGIKKDQKTQIGGP